MTPIFGGIILEMYLFTFLIIHTVNKNVNQSGKRILMDSE